MNQLFKYRLSLPTSKDFRRVLKQGKVLKSAHCRIFIDQNKLSYGRLGIISSKKVVKPAVERHRWRRIIRESFRLNTNLAGWDVVVIITKPLDTKAELWAELAAMWQAMYP